MPPSDTTSIEYPIHRRTLPNGLRVVVSPDHATPTIALNLWVGVGSRHEVAGRTGFAHLFEHLMFQGSRNVASGEHFSALMGVGARLNATTWFDRTNYFETFPKGALDLALWLEADRHGHLLDAVNQENLDNQRDVVKEEKRQRYDNMPYGTALIDIYATLFDEGHPYHHPTIGSMEDLDAASLQDVHDFFHTHYGPNNTVLTIVGDIEVEEAYAAVERHFAALPASASPSPQVGPQLEPLTQPARCDRREDVPNDRVYIAFRLPVDFTGEQLAASAAVDVLGGLASSRLVKRLVRGDETVTSVGANVLGLVDGASIGLFSLDIAEGADVDAVEAAFCEEVQRLIDGGVTEVELEMVLADSERSWLSSLASIEERADHLGHFTCLADDPERINTLIPQIAALTAEQVQQAAARWLQPESRAVIRYLAEEEQQ